MILTVPCLLGLESLVAEELRRMNMKDVRAENGRVHCAGTMADIARLNIGLRCGARVLMELGSFPAPDFEALFQGTAALPWEDFIPKDGEFPVKGYSLNSTLHSVPACQAIVKKASAQRLGRAYGLETLPETGSRYQIQFSIVKDTATLYLDTSGEGLYKRGYRARNMGAPLRETLAAALVLLSCELYRAGLLAAPFYPVFGVLVLGEVYFFADGLTRRELQERLTGEEDDPSSIRNYVPLRQVLSGLFGDKLGAERTTVDNSLFSARTHDELLHALEESDDPKVEAYGRFMRLKMGSGLKPDHNYLASGLELLQGRSILFNNPFYYDLIPYIFYPMNRVMLRRRKVLIVLGRHDVEEDVAAWYDAGLTAVTNIPGMWTIGVLTSTPQELDVGIVSRSSVHDLALHEANEDFFRQVEFVVVMEPSKLVTTAQIGLNSIVRRCGEEGRRPTFCSMDKNCDGLLDSLSHLLLTSFTEVSAVSRLTSLCLILSAPFQNLVRGVEQRVHLLRRAYRYAHPVRERAAQVADEDAALPEHLHILPRADKAGARQDEVRARIRELEAALHELRRQAAALEGYAAAVGRAAGPVADGRRACAQGRAVHAVGVCGVFELLQVLYERLGTQGVAQARARERGGL